MERQNGTAKTKRKTRTEKRNGKTERKNVTAKWNYEKQNNEKIADPDMMYLSVIRLKNEPANLNVEITSQKDTTRS